MVQMPQTRRSSTDASAPVKHHYKKTKAIDPIGAVLNAIFEAIVMHLNGK
jgi:hypothetical protein